MILTNKSRKKFELVDNHMVKLADALGKTESTARRLWKANADMRLSSRKVVDLIAQHTQLQEHEILTPIPA